jgi:hypothetical protein
VTPSISRPTTPIGCPTRSARRWGCLAEHGSDDEWSRAQPALSVEAFAGLRSTRCGRDPGCFQPRQRRSSGRRGGTQGRGRCDSHGVRRPDAMSQRYRDRGPAMSAAPRFSHPSLHAP